MFCDTAHATDNYTCKKGEYVTITNGTAPNRQYSLATHGDGEGGYDNFHVDLMKEPGHKKIGPLTEIKQILDTGAKSYEAVWSSDGRHVAILYREDRYIQTMKLYRIEKGGAFPLEGYDLEEAVVKQKGLSPHPFAKAKRAGGGGAWRLGLLTSSGKETRVLH